MILNYQFWLKEDCLRHTRGANHADDAPPDVGKPRVPPTTITRAILCREKADRNGFRNYVPKGQKKF